jgi:deaminated glutathione amidase
MRDIEAAVIQMCAGPDPGASLARAAELTAEALTRGAELVALPENFWGVAPPGFDRLGWAVDLHRLGPRGELAADPPLLAAQLALSRGSDALIVLGGLPERPGPQDEVPAGAIFNTLAILQRGRVVATYRKIHRFDATLPDGSRLLESASVAAGGQPTVFDAPQACLGLSICYDLRFPELYRLLAAAGAEILLVPSAFTLHTGLAHWAPLLRARAIENQAYVLAPAQQGAHGHGRHSYGHSLIVDPWGAVIAEASRGDGVVMARLRADLLVQVRADLPVLSHRRLLGETSVVRRSLPPEAP